MDKSLKLLLLILNFIVVFGSFGQFSPLDLANLTAWYTGDSVIQSSGSVSQIYDQSGNNYHLIQANSAQQPIVISNGLSNHNVLTFDGINDYMQVAFGNTYSTPNTIFVIYKQTNSNYCKIYDGLSSYHGLRHFNNFLSLRIGGDIIGYSLTSPYDYLINTGVFQGATSKIYENGILKATGFLPNSSLTGLTLGSSFEIGSKWFGGEIAELIVYNSVLSDSDRQQVELYLSEKYSPPFNLGADINAYGFCPQVLTPGQGFNSYLWSNGSTNDSLSVNQSGTYWVQATDPFGLTVSDTIVVTFPTFSVPPTTVFCQGLNTPWDAGLGADYSYLWNTGSTSQSISISTPGDYHVQITDTNGCVLQSDTITFIMDSYTSIASLGNDTTLCAGNLIALQIVAAETVSYLWPDASTGNSYEVDTTGNYFVESINGNGCLAQDTIHISISGTAPAANYSFSNVCDGTPADFVDLSVAAGADPIASWTWDMGDGNILTSQDPSHVYTTPGTYPVELYVESVGGCGAYFTDTIEIFANPSAAYSFTGHCAEYDIQFTDESVDGSAPISNYLWTFDMPWTGAYDTANISIPERIFDTAGSYDVFLHVTDGNGCVDSVTQTIVIDPTPQADFTFVDGCENTAILLTNTSVTQPSSTYLYTFPDNTTSIIPNTSKVFSNYGLQTVILQVTNTFGCIGSVDHDVAVHPKPTPLMDLGPYCMGTYLESADASTIPLGSIDSSVWIFNTQDTLSGSPVYYLIENLGQQQVVLTSYSDQGCSASLSQFIDVTTSLDVSFDAGTGVAAAGDPFTFMNTSTGTSIALWNFGDGTFSTDFSPEHIFSEEYIDSLVDVYLIALNTTGCVDTAYQTIAVQRAEMDLEVTQLFLQKQSDWYIVGVQLKNVGSVRLETIELSMEMAKGVLFNETWTGLLKPLEDSIYVFVGKPSSYISEQDASDAFICVNGVGYDGNGIAEEYLLNNTACKNIEGDNVVLLPIYPNPATESVTFEILVTVESEFSLVLYDARGRAVRTIIPQQSMAAGFYTYPINIEDIAEGSYFVRLKSGTGEVMEKVVIGD